MSNKNLITQSSIGRKVMMASSAMFLLFFLLIHLSINLISLFSEETFNMVSHFMGTNAIIQVTMQPVLIFAVVFHFVLGFILELKNWSSREVKYAMYKGSANATWISRNMIISGLVILAFIGLHFYDFWVHEITVKYIEGNMSGLNAHGDMRYYEELVEKFQNPIRVLFYCVSFILLSLHLIHGFQSAFQSMGVNSTKVTPFLKKLSTIYGILIPLGFIFIALFHFLNH